MSIGADITAGCCRQADSEWRRFLQVAMGCASELEYELLLAHDLSILKSAEYEALITEVTEVKRRLLSFLNKLTAHS